MDLNIHQLLYRNAELETELRLLKEQLAQAHNANTYLLGQMSRSQVAYQTPRTLRTPHLTYDPIAITPERLDLLSFDDAHDSGYGESLWPTPSAPATFVGSPVIHGKQMRARGTAGKDIAQGNSKDQSVARNLIDPSDDSDPSPPQRQEKEFDLKSLRNRPTKSSFGIGILNTHKARGGANGPENGYTITNPDGSVTFVPTGDVEPAKHTEPDANPTNTPEKDEEAPQQAMLEPLPPARPLPAHSPYLPRQNNFHRPHNHGMYGSRWSPYPNHVPSRAPPEPEGPQDVPDLFANPANTKEHHLYRTVLITSIPSMVDIVKALQPTNAVAEASLNIIFTSVGMKTNPPMTTNAATLMFENSVQAVKFVDRCKKESPFQFEAELNLMRTGTSGDFDKEKWVHPRDRQSKPLWIRMDGQGWEERFERRGRTPFVRQEIEQGDGGRIEVEGDRRDSTMQVEEGAGEEGEKVGERRENLVARDGEGEV